MKKKSRLLRNIIFWGIVFYPMYLLLHIALDFYAGSQEFYQQLAKGVYRSILQQLWQGWLGSLWLALPFAVFSSASFFFRRSSQSFPSIFLAGGTLILIVFSFVTPFALLQLLPLFGAFYLCSSMQLLLWRTGL